VDEEKKQKAMDPSDDDPADSDLLRDELKGQTIEHARPSRLEDEGQSGG